MFTVIYGAKNGTQDSIAWWLCHKEGIGPQSYLAPHIDDKRQDLDPKRSTLILDNRSNDEYVECHRLMENVRGDIIEPMRKFEKDYDMLIWSNFFGELKYADQKIDCDKLIICDQDPLEDCFHYVVTHALKPLDHEQIDRDSEVWWRDHMYVNGEEVGQWKEIWYSKYHKQMHEDFDNGKLVYMWQLNFMHWGLQSSLTDNTNYPELKEKDDIGELIKDKVLKHQPNNLDITLTHNPNALYVRDPVWFDYRKVKMILEYLEIPDDENLQDALDKYEKAYRVRRNWFNDQVEKI